MRSLPAWAVRGWRALDSLLPVPARLLLVCQRLRFMLTVRRQHVLWPLRSLVLAMPEWHIGSCWLLFMYPSGLPTWIHSEWKRVHQLPSRHVLGGQRVLLCSMLAWLLCCAAKQLSLCAV